MVTGPALLIKMPPVVVRATRWPTAVSIGASPALMPWDTLGTPMPVLADRARLDAVKFSVPVGGSLQSRMAPLVLVTEIVPDAARPPRQTSPEELIAMLAPLRVP